MTISTPAIGDLATTRPSIERLLRLTRLVSGVDSQSLTDRAEALLALPPEEADIDPRAFIGRRSAALNSDGVPMELAVTSRADGTRHRLVADPAAMFTASEQRLALARIALTEVTQLTGSEPMLPLFESAIEAVLPREGPALSVYRNGPMCIAAAVRGAGVAIYLDARSGGDSRPATRRWLTSVLPSMREPDALLRALEPHADLASVGAEGSTLGNAVAKLYFRLRRPVLLRSLSIDLLGDPSIAPFLMRMAGGFSIPQSGFLLSFGIRIADGALHDVKINLCGHCLRHSSLEWEARLAEQTSELGIAAIPVRALLGDGGFDVSFVTLGVDTSAGRRVNFYVRPALG